MEDTPTATTATEIMAEDQAASVDSGQADTEEWVLQPTTSHGGRATTAHVDPADMGASMRATMIQCGDQAATVHGNAGLEAMGASVQGTTSMQDHRAAVETEDQVAMVACSSQMTPLK
jgi:hypothetical protein